MAKKSGKPLEKTIKLIEETFNNSSDTQVFLSHTLICESGIEREFDVVIKSKVNGYDMCIAIECKDYGVKVSIEKIEAFKSKCSTVKEINKMVFVSANGYQRGAITQAKNFGIDLLTAEKVSVEYLENLAPKVSPLLLQINKINPDYKITLGSDETLEESDFIFDNEIIQYGTDKRISVYHFLEPLLKLSDKGLQGLAFHHYMKNKENIDESPSFIATLSLNFSSSSYFVHNVKKIKIEVTRLEFTIVMDLIKLYSEKSGRVIKNGDNSIKAYSVLLKIDENSESELIIKPNNEISYYHTENKKIKELKTLFQYDALADKIISID